MEPEQNNKGLEWQVGVWNRISKIYEQEVDCRFIPVIEGVIKRGSLKPGDRVLDLGTGTGSLALRAAEIVGHEGSVIGTDISADMLQIGRRRASKLGRHNVEFKEGQAEKIPTEGSTFDVVMASLSLMYVIDRTATAREIARVLRPGGRFIAAVWAGADQCDIVKFQQTAGSFAPPPPVPPLGP